MIELSKEELEQAIFDYLKKNPQIGSRINSITVKVNQLDIMAEMVLPTPDSPAASPPVYIATGGNSHTATFDSKTDIEEAVIGNRDKEDRPTHTEAMKAVEQQMKAYAFRTVESLVLSLEQRFLRDEVKTAIVRLCYNESNYLSLNGAILSVKGSGLTKPGNTAELLQAIIKSSRESYDMDQLFNFIDATRYKTTKGLFKKAIAELYHKNKIICRNGTYRYNVSSDKEMDAVRSLQMVYDGMSDIGKYGKPNMRKLAIGYMVERPGQKINCKDVAEHMSQSVKDKSIQQLTNYASTVYSQMRTDHKIPLELTGRAGEWVLPVKK